MYAYVFRLCECVAAFTSVCVGDTYMRAGCFHVKANKITKQVKDMFV